MNSKTTDLLSRVECVAGYDRAGEPWYQENAGRFLPQLVDAVREMEQELQVLRRLCKRLGEERDTATGLLRAIEALLDDTSGVGTRAVAMRGVVQEVIGARTMHERDTLTPAPPVAEEVGEASP